mgnify:CR=1 FL=1
MTVAGDSAAMGSLDRSCATGLFTEVLLPAPLTTDDTAEDAFFFLEVLDKLVFLRVLSLEARGSVKLHP